MLGLILLSSVEVEPSYIRIGTRENIIAGMGSFNVSFAESSPREFVSLWFMMHVTGLLLDSRMTAPAPFTSNECQRFGKDCIAYILPGQFEWIRNDSYSKEFLDGLEKPEEATGFLVDNAQTYLLEFYPLDNSSTFGRGKCRIYLAESSSNAIRVCLRNDEGHLLAGIYRTGVF